MSAVARSAGPSRCGPRQPCVSALRRERAHLGTTPRAREGRLVDLELGLSQSEATRRAAGVVGVLEVRLRLDELLNERKARRVAAVDEAVDERLEDERAVADPRKHVVLRVPSASMRRTVHETARAHTGSVLDGLAKTMPGFAPWDLDPDGPMLASTPAREMGPSDAM